MPRAAKPRPDPATPAVRRGDEIEIRVAQAWFWEGSYTRHGLNLRRHYQESIQVTDLDLLAIDIDGRLNARRVIGESKSGGGKSAPRPLDRIIWLRGLMELLGDVDAAELTTATQPSRQVRELGRGLGIAVQTIDDLVRREDRLRLDAAADRGSQGVGAHLAVERVHRIVGRDPELERAYWLVRADLWHLSPWMVLKRLMAAIRAIGLRYTPKVKDDTSFALEWLLAEMVSAFAVHLAVVSGFALTMSPSEFPKLVSEQLADPGIDIRRMRQVSDAVDKYIAGVLRQAKAPESAIVDSIGAFAPAAPEYSDALAETARRLSLRVDIARILPRFVDLVIFERLVRGRDVDSNLVERLGSADVDVLVRGARLIAAFLAGQAGLPAAIAEMLGWSVATAPSQPPPDSSAARDASESPPENRRISAVDDKLASNSSSGNSPQSNGRPSISNAADQPAIDSPTIWRARAEDR